MLGVESAHKAQLAFALPMEADAVAHSPDATKALEISSSAQPMEAANDASMMVAISLL